MGGKGADQLTMGRQTDRHAYWRIGSRCQCRRKIWLVCLLCPELYIDPDKQCYKDLGFRRSERAVAQIKHVHAIILCLSKSVCASWCCLLGWNNVLEILQHWRVQCCLHFLWLFMTRMNILTVVGSLVTQPTRSAISKVCTVVRRAGNLHDLRWYHSTILFVSDWCPVLPTFPWQLLECTHWNLSQVQNLTKPRESCHLN